MGGNSLSNKEKREEKKDNNKYMEDVKIVESAISEIEEYEREIERDRERIREREREIKRKEREIEINKEIINKYCKHIYINNKCKYCAQSPLS
mgnify:CR=1 FL=1